MTRTVRKMEIEILYFDGCPNYRATVSLVERLQKRFYLETEVKETEIKDLDAARAQRFLGSPTVRVNGVDVEPSARLSKDFGMMCRVYDSGGIRVGVPPEDLIRRAFEDAIEATRGEG
jgi:hypothetical protein